MAHYLAMHINEALEKAGEARVTLEIEAARTELLCKMIPDEFFYFAKSPEEGGDTKHELW